MEGITITSSHQEDRSIMAQHHHAWKSTLLTLTLAFLCSCVDGGEDPTHDPTEAKEMANDNHSHHEIDYIEFEVSDMAGSKRFYEAAFDWQFNDYGPSYAGIQTRQGGEAGGLRLQPEVSAGGPLVILYSSDLETSLARVREAGGQITEEPFEFPGGRRFHFKDPSGNELAVWSER